MRILSILLLAFSVKAFAGAPALTEAQQKLVKKDTCAAAALEGATSAFISEMKADGVDLPDSIEVDILRVVQSEREYDVRFTGGDSTFQIQTKMGKAKCGYSKVISVP
jgi:hypothetical protein